MCVNAPCAVQGKPPEKAMCAKLLGTDLALLLEVEGPTAGSSAAARAVTQWFRMPSEGLPLTCDYWDAELREVRPPAGCASSVEALVCQRLC